MLKNMEARRQAHLQRKAEEEKAKAQEEERKLREDRERLKKEREEYTDKRPLLMKSVGPKKVSRTTTALLNPSHCSSAGGRERKETQDSRRDGQEARVEEAYAETTCAQFVHEFETSFEDDSPDKTVAIYACVVHDIQHRVEQQAHREQSCQGAGQRETPFEEHAAGGRHFTAFASLAEPDGCAGEGSNAGCESGTAPRPERKHRIAGYQQRVFRFRRRGPTPHVRSAVMGARSGIAAGIAHPEHDQSGRYLRRCTAVEDGRGVPEQNGTLPGENELCELDWDGSVDG